MNVLMVYPEFPDTFWSFREALKFLPGKRATLPPLGLLTIGSMIPESWNTQLIDMNVDKLSDKDIEWSDLVFISAMSIQRDSSLKVISRCSKANKTIVAGGSLFTIEPDDFAQVDHLVLDEAEITLPEFLADFDQGTTKHIYRAKKFPCLYNTPIPSWHLLNMKRYTSMAIQFSRGCPFNCDFCNITSMFGKKVRTKTSEQIINELEALHNAGWRSKVFFVDDNFIGNKPYLKEKLLPSLKKWQKNRGLPFYTEASINLAQDRNLMEMMYEAGFDTVFIGIETPDKTALTQAHKKQNIGINLEEAVHTIQRFGMQVQAGFIVGFDSDDEHIFKRQIDFIQKSHIVTAMVGLLQAPPGTQLYKRLKCAGRILPNFTGNNVDAQTNIIPIMDIDVLRDGYRKILEQIYSPKVYYKRIQEFLRNYRPPKINTRFELINIWAFMRANWRLGIIGRERWQYWKLLFWVLWQRSRKRMSMRMFSLAVTLAIYGNHFRKLTNSFIRQNKEG